MNLKALVRPMLNRLGYDVRRLSSDGGLGLDPFRDMQTLSAHRRKLVVFDVGANVGQSVDRFRETLDDSIIHSFEPEPATFAELRRRKSDVAGVHLNNFALGSSRGTAELNRNTNSDMSSILQPGRDSWGTIDGRISVEVRTLDEYCDDHRVTHIDILKSDTQGYDLEVLKGAEQLLAQGRIKLIYLEIIFSRMYEKLPRPDEVLAYLADHGFSLVSFYEIHYQQERAGWTDALFINPEYELQS
jgi:FkbM family methyltransferase